MTRASNSVAPRGSLQPCRDASPAGTACPRSGPQDSPADDLVEAGPPACRDRDRVATLSVCLITLDEERDLPRCLASVKGLADQIVVVDSGSSDRTVEIARAAGAEVTVRPMTSFADQKNFAFAQATSDWVLGLDADEWLDARLRGSIDALLGSTPRAGVAGYRLRRSVHYLGRRMRGTHAAAEWKTRLVRRGSGRWRGLGPHQVHESLRVNGDLERLAGTLEHEPYRDLREHVEKLWRYANAAPPASRGRVLFGLTLEPPLVLFKEMVLLGGLRDGTRGLVHSTLTAFYFFLCAASQWQAPRPRSGSGLIDRDG